MTDNDQKLLRQSDIHYLKYYTLNVLVICLSLLLFTQQRIVEKENLYHLFYYP